MSTFRTDSNRNPIAATSDVAKEAGLTLGVDYNLGDPFTVSGPGNVVHIYHTAHFLGDPVETSIRVIDAVGYFTSHGTERWTYCAIPFFLWKELTPVQKKAVIAYHYTMEGGTEMKSLFT